MKEISMNIYVGNLPYDLNEEEIKALFAEFGEVSTVTLVNDRESGRPKGFGFVEMADDSKGEAAIAALNGKEIKGRTIRVDKATPKTERPRGGGGDRGGRGGYGRGR
jgi:RNA recognition motif-containing protein